MDGDDIGEIIQHKERVVSERIDRDKFYLMATRSKIMKELSSDSIEWITEEIKEQLEMIELIKKLDNKMLVEYAKAIEKRIKEIHKNYKRNIILPMMKLSKRKAKSTNELEHYTKITQSIQNCNNLILELLEYRVRLDSLTRIDESRAELCPAPNMITERAPEGMYQ